ncbi:MAG: 23S rRNA (adenine(2503)-C(2))-methyltransferase RlmN [Bacteroidaceae bacterium]|nr:23S rRNA (adenine(2503)-C(2))-methyltransferase RlmN [Bacteroidaceae bacterium]
MEKQHLVGKTLEELQEVAAQCGMPSFAAKQLAQWIYVRRVNDIEVMTNISKAHRARLAETYDVGYYAPSHAMQSVDGTAKYLYDVGTTTGVEAVYIPDRQRATLCVSSQVGCKMNCYFCMTGKQGFTRNLTSHEIINQIISVPKSETLTNLVFMGMGEPLDNLDELLKVLRILTEPWGLAWSPRRITVSTIGYRPGLRRFIEETECHLALSLHAPYPEQRAEVMPVEKAFPVKELLALLREYDWSHQRRLSFEYIVFRDFNDSIKHADALVKLLGGIPCLVNLIRFHAIPGVELKTSEMTQIEAFRDRLNERGVTATIRASRGEDIFAACGMLSTAKNNS